MFFQLENSPFWQAIADIMSFILNVFRPIVQPIGTVLVFIIDFLLNFFPSENITIYVVIFCILVGSAIYINCKWPGEVYLSVYKKEGDKSSDVKEKKPSNVEYLDKKADKKPEAKFPEEIEATTDSEEEEEPNL